MYLYKKQYKLGAFVFNKIQEKLDAHVFNKIRENFNIYIYTPKKQEDFDALVFTKMQR